MVTWVWGGEFKLQTFDLGGRGGGKDWDINYRPRGWTRCWFVNMENLIMRWGCESITIHISWHQGGYRVPNLKYLFVNIKHIGVTVIDDSWFVIRDLSYYDRENPYISNEIFGFDPGFWNNIMQPTCKHCEKEKNIIRFYGGKKLGWNGGREVLWMWRERVIYLSVSLNIFLCISSMKI